MELNFSFSETSWKRCTSPDGYNMEPGRTHTPEAFNMFLAMSMAEELGEMLGALKKIIRGFNPREFKKLKKKTLEKLRAAHAKEANDSWLEQITQTEAMEWSNDPETTMDAQPLYMLWVVEKMSKLKSEAADFTTYFDLFLTHNNINLQASVVKTFNEVSADMNCPQFKIQY